MRAVANVNLHDSTVGAGVFLPPPNVFDDLLVKSGWRGSIFEWDWQLGQRGHLDERTPPLRSQPVTRFTSSSSSSSSSSSLLTSLRARLGWSLNALSGAHKDEN
jgi:hypothetical protein